MCAIFQSLGTAVNITGVIIMLISLAVLIRAAYLTLLGWGDPETLRFVRGMALKGCAGLLSVWLLDLIARACT